MKFRVTFKDPDGVSESLFWEAKKSVEEISGIEEDELEDLIKNREEKLSKFIRKWVEYDEYLTVEFDTEAGTASVVQREK